MPWNACNCGVVFENPCLGSCLLYPHKRQIARQTVTGLCPEVLAGWVPSGMATVRNKISGWFCPAGSSEWTGWENHFTSLCQLLTGKIMKKMLWGWMTLLLAIRLLQGLHFKEILWGKAQLSSLHGETVLLLTRFVVYRIRHCSKNNMLTDFINSSFTCYKQEAEVLI